MGKVRLLQFSQVYSNERRVTSKWPPECFEQSGHKNLIFSTLF